MRRWTIEKATEIYGIGSTAIDCIFVIEDNRKLTTTGAKLKRKRYETLGFRYEIPEDHFADEVLHTGTRIALDDPVRHLRFSRHVEIDGNYINGVKVMNDDNDIAKQKYMKEMERRVLAGEDMFDVREDLDEKYDVNWTK